MSSAAVSNSESIAPSSDASDFIDASGVNVISSLCVACEERGETRLMLLKIPFFRDIILAAFTCEHCGKHSETPSYLFATGLSDHFSTSPALALPTSTP